MLQRMYPAERASVDGSGARPDSFLLSPTPPFPAELSCCDPRSLDPFGPHMFPYCRAVEPFWSMVIWSKCNEFV